MLSNIQQLYDINILSEYVALGEKMKKNLLLFISVLLYGSIGSTYAGNSSEPTTNLSNWRQVQASDILNVVGLNVVGKNITEEPNIIKNNRGLCHIY